MAEFPSSFFSGKTIEKGEINYKGNKYGTFICKIQYAVETRQTRIVDGCRKHAQALHGVCTDSSFVCFVSAVELLVHVDVFYQHSYTVVAHYHSSVFISRMLNCSHHIGLAVQNKSTFPGFHVSVRARVVAMATLFKADIRFSALIATYIFAVVQT